MSDLSLFAEAFKAVDDPEFPFSDSGWSAVAFERDGYDGARLPESFFRAASRVFGGGEVKLLVAGYCVADAGCESLVELPFCWTEFHRLMTRPGAYSTDIRFMGSTAEFACWGDADVTIFGGQPDRMEVLFEMLGGRDCVLQNMRNEFILGEVENYPEMEKWFDMLLNPGHR